MYKYQDGKLTWVPDMKRKKHPKNGYVVVNCRVSTADPNQKTAFKLQKEEYAQRIEKLSSEKESLCDKTHTLANEPIDSPLWCDD